MKSPLKHHPITGFSSGPRGAFFAVVLLSLAGMGFAAHADNISTQKNGAVVIYSTPLARGASPDLLINGQPGSLSFSKKSRKAPRLLVIDLGKSYKLDTVQLNYSRATPVKVYVVSTKPDSTTSWKQLVGELQPNAVLDSSGAPTSVSGAQGEYLVIASDRDPGAFSGLYVTGITTLALQIPTTADNPPSSTALSETPYQASVFQKNPVPPVPPESH